MFWQEGQLIYNGKYKIEKYLGGGGFAVTYQAIHTKLNRRVVIKTPNICVQRDANYPKYVERFKKEAEMLQKNCRLGGGFAKANILIYVGLRSAPPNLRLAFRYLVLFK